MKKFIAANVLLLGIFIFGQIPETNAQNIASDWLAQVDTVSEGQGYPVTVTPDHADVSGDEHAVHTSAPYWLVIPFIVLLLMIATGPLFYEHFWHHNYPKVAVGLALLVVF